MPSSVVGVGIDVVDITRFKLSLERVPRLRDRLFCGEELSLTTTSLAARFAAKEALAKALFTPGNLRWEDAEVRRGEHGAPYFVIRGTVQDRVRELGITALHLSLSHDAGIASAIVLAEGNQRVN